MTSILRRMSWTVQYFFIISLVPFNALKGESTQDLDNVAIQLFEKVKDQLIQETDPVLIGWPDRLSLYQHGLLKEYTIINSTFNDLKTISHLCILGLYGLLYNPIENDSNWDKILAYRNMLIEVEQKVEKLTLSEMQKKRQKELLQRTVNFLNDVMKTKQYSFERIHQFFITIRPLGIQNVIEGGEIVIQLLNQHMQTIKDLLSPEDYQRLFVLIPTSKMTSKKNLSSQFFSKYLKQPINSDRFIIAEGVTDSKEAFSVIGDWKVQNALGKIFFKDPNQMQSEILGVYTEDYLNQYHPFMKNGLVCPMQ